MLKDGSGCKVVLAAASGLVMRLSRDGIGARVGSGFSAVVSALELAEELAGEEKSE